MLGNVGVYCDASVDPETLLHSRAAMARALARGPLVNAAMRGGGDGLPLLRGITAQSIAESPARSRCLCLPSACAACANLPRTLSERHGVDARVGDGAFRRRRVRGMREAFCAGEFPVLCLSRRPRGPQSPERAIMVHLDLPVGADRA